MKTQWKRRLIQVTVAVTTEIVLNMMGLDTLADYSEFVFGRDWDLDVAITLTSGRLIDRI